MKKLGKKLLIDEDGNILNNGSGGSSGDNNNDDDNKFPSWDKLKEKVAKSGGNVALAVSSLLPFVALYGYSALEKSGANLADKLIDDGINVDTSYIDADTVGFLHFKAVQTFGDYRGDSVILHTNAPVCFSEFNGHVNLYELSYSNDALNKDFYYKMDIFLKVFIEAVSILFLVMLILFIVILVKFIVIMVVVGIQLINFFLNVRHLILMMK